MTEIVFERYRSERKPNPAIPLNRSPSRSGLDIRRIWTTRLTGCSPGFFRRHPNSGMIEKGQLSHSHFFAFSAATVHSLVS